MIAKGLLMGMSLAGVVMAVEPLRPTPMGMNWVFDDDVSVQVRVLDASLPDGRVIWRRGASSWASTWESDGTGFTAEVSRVGGMDLWVLHFQADKPGGLGFRTSIANPKNPARPQGRRLLVSEADGEPLSVWVFPMESDVERDGGAILLRGEGEAVVIVARGAAALAKVRLAGVQGDRTDDVAALLGNLNAGLTVRPPAPAPADAGGGAPADAETLPIGDDIELLPEDE